MIKKQPFRYSILILISFFLIFCCKFYSKENYPLNFMNFLKEFEANFQKTTKAVFKKIYIEFEKFNIKKIQNFHMKFNKPQGFFYLRAL